MSGWRQTSKHVWLIGRFKLTMWYKAQAEVWELWKQSADEEAGKDVYWVCLERGPTPEHVIQGHITTLPDELIGRTQDLFDPQTP